MFVIFDIDDIFDGASAGVGMLIKLLIGMAVLGVYVGFLTTGDGYGMVGITFSVCLAFFISNILTIIEGYKELKHRESEKDSHSIGKSNIDRLKKNLIITIIATITLMIIGYFITIKIWNIKINKLATMSLLPFIFNIAFTYLLDFSSYRKNKPKEYYIHYIIDYIKDRIIGQVMPIFLIILFIISLAFVLLFPGQQVLGDKQYNFMINTIEKVTKNISYYDDSFDNKRDGRSALEVAKNNLFNIIEMSKNKNEINKLQELNPNTNKEDLKKTIPFTKVYLSTNKDSLKDEYGISISFSTHPYDDKENSNKYVMSIFDYAYGTINYYEYDFESAKVTKKFKCKNEAIIYADKINKESKSKTEEN